MRQFEADKHPASLAERQAALVAAVAGEATDLPGFDCRQVASAAAALRHKRGRAIAKAWPGLAASLESTLPEALGGYMQSHPWPEQQPLDDAAMFGRWLNTRGLLSRPCQLDLFRLELAHRETSLGLRPRRGLALGVRILRRPWAIAAGLHLPIYGTCVIAVPLGPDRCSKS